MYSSSRDLEILRPKGGKSEGRDNYARERRQGGVGNLSANSHHEEDPCLGVFDCLPCLVGLEMMVLDTLSIGRYTTDGYLTLAFCEKFRSGGTIREEEKGHDSPRDRDRSKDQEHVHPLLEAGFDMPDCVAD